MEKTSHLFWLLALIFVMGCGTMGYRVKRGTGDHGKAKGEIYYDLKILDFDSLWKKK